MTGFGDTEFGLFGFGLGNPGEATPLVKPKLDARDLDPNTKDFYLDSNDNLGTTSQVRQRVLLALTSTYGFSSVFRDFGNKIMKLQYLDDKAESLAKAYVRDALKQISQIEKLIAIDSITVRVSPGGRLEYMVNYRDLTTKQADTVIQQLG